MATGPSKPVLPPPATPPQHSLVASAQPITDNDERWQLGLVWVPELCGVVAGVWDPCPVDAGGNPVAQVNKSSGTAAADEETYSPFVVEMESGCHAAFLAGELEQRARRQFEAYYPGQVEREFWTGSLRPDNFALQRRVPRAWAFQNGLGDTQSGVVNAEATGGADAATPVKDGLALDMLAQALAGCAAGSRGMIHAPASSVERWCRMNHLERDGVRLVTKNRGDIVVSYSNTPPNGPLAYGAGVRASSLASVWIYATSLVTIRQTDMEIVAGMPTGSTLARQGDGSTAGAFYPRVNLVTYRAERTVALLADPCCAFAARVEGPGAEAQT